MSFIFWENWGDHNLLSRLILLVAQKAIMEFLAHFCNSHFKHRYENRCPFYLVFFHIINLPWHLRCRKINDSSDKIWPHFAPSLQFFVNRFSVRHLLSIWLVKQISFLFAFVFFGESQFSTLKPEQEKKISRSVNEITRWADSKQINKQAFLQIAIHTISFIENNWLLNFNLLSLQIC